MYVCMTDASRIFDTLRPLSSPTTAAESVELVSDVAAMVAAHTIARELPMTKTASRRKSVATMVIAGVIGFGGVAAAGPGGFDVLDSGTPAPSTTSTTTTVVPDDEAPSTTVADQTDTSTTAAPETTDAPASPSTSTEPTTTVGADGDETNVLVDDPTTAFDETQCADGNHGKTVSSVAQATEGPNKGQTVRDAAHSSCGKQTKDDSDDSDEAEHDDDSDDADESEHDDDSDDATDADDSDEHDDDTDDESDDKGKSKRPKGSRDTEATTPTAATPSPSSNGNSNSNSNGKNKDK